MSACFRYGETTGSYLLFYRHTANGGWKDLALDFDLKMRIRPHNTRMS